MREEREGARCWAERKRETKLGWGREKEWAEGEEARPSGQKTDG